MKYISRDDGKSWYLVIDETETDYATVSMFEYDNPPRKQQLKLWWNKSLCIVKEDTPPLSEITFIRKL